MNLKADAAGQCAREKYWSEKNSDERIYTLAQELATALVSIQQLQEKIAKIEGHSHGSAGNMLVPYLDGRGGLNEVSPYGYKYADRVFERLGLRERL